MRPNRRTIVASAAAAVMMPWPLRATTPRELTWDDLIPPGVPYSKIIADGEKDPVNDRWRPVFDENATRLHPELRNAWIRMPGYIIPLELTADGATQFLLVPYVGACLHVPPPPANQLVMVHSKTPWPGTDLWQAVWVAGRMTHDVTTTDLARVGYRLEAETVEEYSW